MMNPEKVLKRLNELGVSLRMNGDRITAYPRESVTNEAAQLIRENKAALMVALSNVVPIRRSSPELCRSATESLSAHPDKEFWASADEAAPGPCVVVAVAIRRGSVIDCREVLIAKDRFDLGMFWQVFEKHSQKVDPALSTEPETVAA